MNRHEIPEALGHLLAFDLEKAVMQPVVGHRRCTECAARLGDLVLVMREDQVNAAAVNVKLVRMGAAALTEACFDLLPQPLVRHRRALKMPAGPAGRGNAAR